MLLEPSFSLSCLALFVCDIITAKKTKPKSKLVARVFALQMTANQSLSLAVAHFHRERAASVPLCRKPTARDLEPPSKSGLVFSRFVWHQIFPFTGCLFATADQLPLIVLITSLCEALSSRSVALCPHVCPLFSAQLVPSLLFSFSSNSKL